MARINKYGIKVSRYKASDEGNSPIIFRVTYQSKRIELYTGYSCNFKQWDTNKERIKKGTTSICGYSWNQINSILDEMQGFIQNYFQDSMYRSSDASLKDLKERFNYKYKRGVTEQSDEFFFLFDEFIIEESRQCGWEESMSNTFIRLKELIKEYNPNLTFADLRISTMDEIKVHLSKTMLNEALIKRLSYFNRFVKWAETMRKCKVHEEFHCYKPKLKKGKIAVQFLTREELLSIVNLQLEEGSVLDLVRDAFVFQCHTALRFSDLEKLKKDDIIKTKQGYDIDILTKKDSDRVRYPLTTIAKKIYEKYAQKKFDGGVLIPIMSNQKYNEHLKQLGKLANLEGEWKDYHYRLNEVEVVIVPKSDLCSHTARRTFISLAIEAGVPESHVARITSHSEVKNMKPYIGTTRKSVENVIEAFEKGF